MSIVTYNNRSIANISAIPGAAKSLTHIKTLTASSSANLSFVDGSSDVVLDNTYPIYLFKFINIHGATEDAEFQFQGSTDSGSNYNTTITSSAFQANQTEGASTFFGYNSNWDLAQSTNFQTLFNNLDADNDECLSGHLHLFNPSNTTFVKHFMSRIQGVTSADSSQDDFRGGYFNSTSAIDAIQFKMSSGNIDAGTIKLYGIKDS
jgi:hypothetical protein